MGSVTTDFDWLATEALALRILRCDAGNVDVLCRTLEGRPRAAVLSTPGTSPVLVNGEFYDFGDNFPVILGLLDEAYAYADAVAGAAEGRSELVVGKLPDSL